MSEKNKIRKKILSLVILVAICFSSVPVYGLAPKTRISDHWASEKINEWIDKDLIRGYPDNSIRPNNDITRAEFFTLTNNAVNFSGEAVRDFKDVKESDWYYKNVMKGVFAGYVAGYPDNTIRPNEFITREEVATVIANINGLNGNTDNRLNFYDKTEISTWSMGYVDSVVSFGIMNGYPDGNFMPKKNITRAEAIVSLDKALQIYYLNNSLVTEGKIFNEAGIFGPSEGIEKIDSKVIVEEDGVTLQNLIINGDLIISEKLGDGDLTLNNITVLGTTFVRGGGANSIHINAGEYEEILIEKTSSEKTRIVAKNADISKVTISENATGQGVILEGDFQEIDVYGSEMKIEIVGNTNISKFNINSIAKGNKIIIEKDSKISLIKIEAETSVTGKGLIENAEILSSILSGVDFEIQPLKIEVNNKANSTKSRNSQSGNNISDNSGNKEEGKDNEEDTKNDIISSYEVNGFEASNVKLVQEGNRINDHQIGFQKTKDSEKELELSGNFTGWLLMYSYKDIDTVWNYLSNLSEEDITNHSNTDGENRIYRITNYSWADGLGNTFRANQRDVVTGEEFHPNRYRLYVATQTKDGVIALAEADKNIYIKPYPKKVILHGSGEQIGDYSLEFESFNHSDIEYNVIFYSTETIYEPNLIAFLDKSMEDIEELIDEKRLKKADKLNGIEFFEDNQISLEGKAFGENIYYGYVAAIGSSGVLGVAYSKSMIITKNTPNPETELINDGKGTVFAVGGSTDSSNYEYMFRILDDIGRTPRIAIFSSSRDDLATVINHYYYDDPQFGSLKNDWLSRGFEPVFIPLAIDSRDFVANNDYYSALVKTCDAIWLQGGDQNKHGKSLLNDNGSDTSIMEAIRYVYSRGGVIAGTSAGMHIMSNNAFGYGNSDIALQVNDTEFYSISDIPTTGDLFPNISNNNLSVPGINIMPSGVLNDTHFDARGRLGRLIVAMRDTGKTIGIGSDEGTGIAIRENIGTVIGVHGVFIVDGENGEYSQSGEGSIFNASDIKVHYLTHGDSYNFETGEIVISNYKEEIEPDFNKPVYETDDIFGKYETTKAMIGFVNSGENKVSYRVKSNSNPQFEVVFEKTENTSSYQSSDSYKDSALAGVKRTSILNLSLKIQEYKKIDEFVLSSVEIGRSGNDTEFAVTFIFNQPIKVGYKGSSGDYLNDLEDPEYFVEILRGEEILEQGKSSLKIVDGNKLEIVAGKEDFENGDLIVLKTTIESVFEGTLTEEIRYSHMDGNWILSSDYEEIQEEILEEVKEEVKEEAQEDIEEEIIEETQEDIEEEIIEDIQEETVEEIIEDIQEEVKEEVEEEILEEILEEIQKEVEKRNE